MPKAIIVNDLAKQYRLSHLYPDSMLRERIVSFFKHPFRRTNANDDCFWALKDVSFTVEQGEVLGVIGRNGAGKSTLLKLLSKITYPTSGQISVRGRFASLLEVGTGFHEELTGRENIFLNGSILGMTGSQIQAKLDAIVAFAEVDKFIDMPIKRYSSGMRLRLGFAVAAHLDAEVLIVDEVLAVGDIGFQRKCLATMSDLQRGGRTVLFVSHNMASVENLCSRAIWLEKGRCREDGHPREVIQNYMATFAGKQAAGSDLGDFEGRRGAGGIRYTGVEFLGSDRRPLPVVRSGDRLIVRLHYHAEKRISNLIVFGFRIFTDLGTLVTDVSTANTGNFISNPPLGRGYVEVEIDGLYLMPMTYSMSLSLHNGSGLIYDGLEHCISLSVEVSDFYQSGRGLDRRNGIMFLPYRWHFDGMDNSRQKQFDRAARQA